MDTGAAQPLSRHLSLDELSNRKPDLIELRKLREEQEAIAYRCSEASKSGTSLFDEFDSQHRPKHRLRVRSDPFSKASSLGLGTDPSSKGGLFKPGDSRLENPFIVPQKSPTGSPDRPTLPTPLFDSSDFERRPQLSQSLRSDPFTLSNSGGHLPPVSFENSRPGSSLESPSVVPEKSLTASPAPPARRPFAGKTRSSFLQQALATTAPYISISRPVTRAVTGQVEPPSSSKPIKRKADNDDSSEKKEDQTANAPTAPKKRKVANLPKVQISDEERKARLRLTAQGLIEKFEAEELADRPSNYDEYIELFKRSADPTIDTRDPESLVPSVSTAPKTKKRRSKKDKDDNNKNEASEPPKKRRRRKGKNT